MTFAETFLALLAAGGGGAVIALGIVRAFGERWLDSKFANRLQDLRHEHERQMERIRLETQRKLDRSIRLSEREFEATADAWSLVFEVQVRTMAALPGLRQQDDFSRLSDELAKIVAIKNGFEEFEIDALLAQPKGDRNSYFGDQKRFHEMRDAKIAIREASNYLDRKALFLDRDVYYQLSEFVGIAWKALIAREIVMEVGSRGIDGIERNDQDFQAQAEAKLKELENLVRSRFWQPLELFEKK